MKNLYPALVLAAPFLGSASVKADAPEIKLGAEYQVNMTYSDDGLNSPNESKRYELNLKGAKVFIRGKLSDTISWTVLYKAKESQLERFWVTNKISDELEISAGQQKIKVYGLHRNLSSGTKNPIIGAYLAANPLTDKMALDISYKAPVGAFSLQLIEDYSKCADKSTSQADLATGKVTTTNSTSCTSWTEAGIQKQPAVALEWLGAVGEFQPLVQYAIYDLGKSNTASLGLRYKTDQIDSYVDFTQDTRNAKGLDSGGSVRKEKNVYKGSVAYIEYKFETYTPFLHYSQFSTEPYLAPGVKTSDKVKAQSNASGKLDKLESTLAVGTYFDSWGPVYRPFAHVAVSSGRYVDPNDTAKDRVLTKKDLVAGIIGKF